MLRFPNKIGLALPVIQDRITMTTVSNVHEGKYLLNPKRGKGKLRMDFLNQMPCTSPCPITSTTNFAFIFAADTIVAY